MTDWSGVTAVIAAAEGAGATVGVAAIAPGGAVFGHNADRRFVAASTVKIAIAIELLRRVEAGSASLDERHVLRPADKATGSGIVAALHDGIELTLGDLAYLMMSISDNSSTNILIDRLGQAAINETMRGLSMTGSTLGRRMRGAVADATEQENWAVPAEYARLIAALLAGTVLPQTGTARMLGLLESQQNERRIARHLPRDPRPRWGSKTGSLTGVCNDVGFVHTERGPAVMAIFCEIADPHDGEQLIGDIARAVLAAG